MAYPTLDTELLTTLFDAAVRVSKEGELRSVLRSIVKSAMDITGARYGALGVVGRDGYLIEFTHEGMDDDAVERIGHTPIGIGVLGAITRTGTTVRLDDISAHPESSGFPDGHPEMRSFLGVPVHIGDTIFGNLYLTEKDGDFSDFDERAIEALAMVGGFAVANARIHQHLRRAAVAEDRARIARDVHDDTIQDLFAIGLSLQALAESARDEPTANALRTEVQRIDACITSLRHLILDLRQLEPHRGLREEVTELVDELSDAHGVEARVLVDGVFEAVPNAVAESVLHIVKEATSNALRHSGSQWVEVVLFGADESIAVSINDAGKGFDPDGHYGGLGLTNLRARAVQAGGKLEILTGEGRGTTLRALIPVDRSRRSD
ncbi:MAG TPA: GAF domain-containing sensor histidine kinase [Acidimicrobiia bacterium]|jgi:signal transduction histidine kinase|nr:GAF domain-containing sensor histidine kinase [Acidimicrobiia bacterium]